MARGWLGNIPGAGCGRASSPSPWTGTAWWPQARWTSRRLHGELGRGFSPQQGPTGEVCSPPAPGPDPATAFAHRFRSQRAVAADPGGGRRNPGAPTASCRMWVCRSAAPWRHARPPAATRAPWASPPCPTKDRSPWDPTSLGVMPCILLSLCLSRYRLPTLPCRQPEPSPGHQDSPAALPGGRGPARRSPRWWPERRQHGGECRRGGHRACSILDWHAASPPKSPAPCSWLGVLGVPLILWDWDTLAVGVPVGVGASRMLGGLAHPTPQQ